MKISKLALVISLCCVTTLTNTSQGIAAVDAQQLWMALDTTRGNATCTGNFIFRHVNNGAWQNNTLIGGFEGVHFQEYQSRFNRLIHPGWEQGQSFSGGVTMLGGVQTPFPKHVYMGKGIILTLTEIANNTGIANSTGIAKSKVHWQKINGWKSTNPTQPKPKLVQVSGARVWEGGLPSPKVIFSPGNGIIYVVPQHGSGVFWFKFPGWEKGTGKISAFKHLAKNVNFTHLSMATSPGTIVSIQNTPHDGLTCFTHPGWQTGADNIIKISSFSGSRFWPDSSDLFKETRSVGAAGNGHFYLTRRLSTLRPSAGGCGWATPGRCIGDVGRGIEKGAHKIIKWTEPQNFDETWGQLGSDIYAEFERFSKKVCEKWLGIPDGDCFICYQQGAGQDESGVYACKGGDPNQGIPPGNEQKERRPTKQELSDFERWIESTKITFFSVDPWEKGLSRFLPWTKLPGSALSASFGLVSPTGSNTVRSRDGFGIGYFLATRPIKDSDGNRVGTKWHAGVDYVVKPGSPVYAPVTGRVDYIGYPYGQCCSKGLRTIHIVQGGYRFIIMYVNPGQGVKIGSTILRGLPMGQAQDVRIKYPDKYVKGKLRKMTPHIHLTIVDPNGRRVSPGGKYSVKKGSEFSKK